LRRIHRTLSPGKNEVRRAGFLLRRQLDTTAHGVDYKPDRFRYNLKLIQLNVVPAPLGNNQIAVTREISKLNLLRQ
jgi:hypothetical protein